VAPTFSKNLHTPGVKGMLLAYKKKINCKMKQDYRENHLKLAQFLCDIGHLGRTLKQLLGRLK
jgi:hypothetical protein